MKVLPEGSWPESWERKTNPDSTEESFEEWLVRTGIVCPRLDPRALEQWVYRHGNLSPYAGYPVSELRSELKHFSTEEVLGKVGISPFAQYESTRNATFEHLSKIVVKGERIEPMKSIHKTGTWNFPILVMHCADGFRVHDESFPQYPYWLIEGHMRRNFLWAANGHISLQDKHEVLVLSDE